MLVYVTSVSVKLSQLEYVKCLYTEEVSRANFIDNSLNNACLNHTHVKEEVPAIFCLKTETLNTLYFTAYRMNINE